jgi:hypothetical protein
LEKEIDAIVDSPQKSQEVCSPVQVVRADNKIGPGRNPIGDEEGSVFWFLVL